LAVAVILLVTSCSGDDRATTVEAPDTPVITSAPEPEFPDAADCADLVGLTRPLGLVTLVLVNAGRWRCPTPVMVRQWSNGDRSERVALAGKQRVPSAGERR
jgi:hypothetical protein